MTTKQLQIFVAIGALALGCILAFLPKVVTNLPESGVLGQVKLGFACLQIPGIVAGLVIYRNVHTINSSVVEAINFVFYAAASYILLRKLCGN